ncbi:hypothetical protein HPB51_019356 [Rhipicephalus microplus]|uniref:Uncharacterized protein n=1 Tax=Rhipicephalus microplus TaxID=6941 RepID=A0A9J6DBA7_RHIMP|nr:hypothetical protein HPB51_019356 [Rhipicephalus microplus]
MERAWRRLQYRPPPLPRNQVARDLAFRPSQAPDHRSLPQPNTMATASFASFAAAPPAPPTYHWPLHPAALDPSYCRDRQYSCDTVPPFSPYGPGPMPRQEPASGAMRVQCHRCGGFGHISRNCVTGRRMGPPVCFRCQRSGHLQAQCPGNQWRYMIDRSSDKKRQFKINPNGVVEIQRTLDREDIPRHQVKILAIDDGVPSRTATATLTVVVSDINDNPPRFQYDYRPVIPEHTPPQKVQEILATDDDDRSKNNGPPFTFRMDPNAPELIQQFFRVEHDPTGANGDGMAVVRSRETFDRETQKEYLVPILIKDNGNPSLTGTSTLTVIIGDVNDNRMHPGSKSIFVYNFKGESPPTKIGRIHVEDLDDWDLPDKTFFWENNNAHPNFDMDGHTGMITMLNSTGAGTYHLRFLVYDRMHTMDAHANVTVTVKEIPEEAIYNSGSIRVTGITDEDFIRVWDWKKQRQVKSKYEIFRDLIAERIKTKPYNVDIFSVILKQSRPPITDIRFSAHGSPYYKASLLNGVIAVNRREIEEKVGINITMVGIDECLLENHNCEGSCTNVLMIDRNPVMVNANRTSFVGVNTWVKAKCTCGARDFSDIESCRKRPPPCYNNGRCVDTYTGIRWRDRIPAAAAAFSGGGCCDQGSWDRGFEIKMSRQEEVELRK